jgi:RNA polymerase sigma-70 factor (ECF subfamily)
MNGQVILSGSMLGIAESRALGESRSAVDVAVEQLVREHARLVFRIAYSMLRDHHEAEDAAQEVFVRVLKYKDRLPQVREQKSWLARIAWRCSLERSQARRARAQSDVSIHHERDDTPSADASTLRDLSANPEQLAASAQVNALLERMIASLPDDLRQTLSISTVQELSSAEVAEVLGIPEGSVRTRLMRARKLLKQKLQMTLGEKL